MDVNLACRRLTEDINAKRGGGGKWPADFKYSVEPGRLCLRNEKNLTKKVFRCMDSWGIALLHEIRSKHSVDLRELSFELDQDGMKRSPDLEAFVRRVSYLDINNEDIRFRVTLAGKPVGLYDRKGLFNRPDSEIIHEHLNEKTEDGKESFLEKSFQSFLFGKGLDNGERTNERMAVLGDHFFKLKKKGYWILREFPTGSFDGHISIPTKVTPTERVDIVTLNRYGQLSVIELKLDDTDLQVMSQMLDYALYFRCYLDKLLLLLERSGKDLPKKTAGVMCYVVNNCFHSRFDDIFDYYKPRDGSYNFSIMKVLLGYTTPR